jgi:hypothetical protein
MAGRGLARDALYLIRPDGYVALADRDLDAEKLGGYFTSRGLSARCHTTLGS